MQVNDIRFDDYEVKHDLIIRASDGLYRLQKLILDANLVRRTIQRYRDWVQSFVGNNEEGASTFIMETIKTTMSNQNSHLMHSMNTLMFRYAMLKAVDRNGEKIFDFFDLLRFTFLCADREGYNTLELDNEFVKRLLSLGDSDEDEFNEMVSWSLKRLEIRVHLATLVKKEAERRK